jgi:hypothetical protein
MPLHVHAADVGAGDAVQLAGENTAVELSAAIPGFAEALAWPDGERAMHPC